MALEGYNQYDIRGYSFDEFIDFIFNHEVNERLTNGERPKDPWYYMSEVECSPETVIEYYIRLFKEPEFLFSRFSREQLEQGFWLVPGESLECSIGEVIWDESVTFENRAECVRSMFYLYEKFFAIDFLKSSGEMWWDSLCYDWHCGNRSRSNGGEDLLMQDVMFETLERILALSSENSQAAALHGLGHLHHPKTVEVIDAYLERNQHLDLGLVDYARAASRFEVL